ncbi:hypothetical protein [Pseudomonas paeninsulae]|uniref:hypothetical protein n=1 Tax=Pseudomonas paeninsulae TaxID=3110772 RepID=UPI002D794A81|nr:hypothetical protein [Pseudomonas sp. IT1137]
MTPELQAVMVFVSAFAQVFLLGLNSKLLRDDKIAPGFVVSWMITLAQFAYIWAVAHASIDTAPFLVISGLGGSLGITAAQYFYRWYDRKFHRKGEQA